MCFANGASRTDYVKDTKAQALPTPTIRAPSQSG